MSEDDEDLEAERSDKSIATVREEGVPIDLSLHYVMHQLLRNSMSDLYSHFNEYGWFDSEAASKILRMYLRACERLDRDVCLPQDFTSLIVRSLSNELRIPRGGKTAFGLGSISFSLAQYLYPDHYPVTGFSMICPVPLGTLKKEFAGNDKKTPSWLIEIACSNYVIRKREGEKHESIVADIASELSVSTRAVQNWLTKRKRGFVSEV